MAFVANAGTMVPTSASPTLQPKTSCLGTRAPSWCMRAVRPAAAPARGRFLTTARAQRSDSQRQPLKQQQQQQQGAAAALPRVEDLLFTSAGLYLLSELPAAAEALDASPAYSQGSYVVSLGLFLVTLPGLWSLIKRAPKSKIKRKTFEVDGPGKPGAVGLDVRARAIFAYFKKYNYEVKGTGDVITFVGNFKASNSQAAALTLYTLISLLSCALVLSIAAPFGGNWWYLMTLISPAAGYYYLQNANRQEEFSVKMVTSDDEQVTDIVVLGDDDEIERMRRELNLYEKDMVYVKGILET